MNGFISDLSDAAMEVLKEAQVLFTVLLFSCIQVVQCLNKFASLLDLDNRLFRLPEFIIWMPDTLNL